MGRSEIERETITVITCRDTHKCDSLENIEEGHAQEIKRFLTSLALQSDRNCPTLHPRRAQYIMDREQCRRRPLLSSFIPHSESWISALTPFPLLLTGAVFYLVSRTLFAAFYFMPIFFFFFFLVDGQAQRNTTNTKSRSTTTVRMLGFNSS